jgi:hypothetical protein
MVLELVLAIRRDGSLARQPPPKPERVGPSPVYQELERLLGITPADANVVRLDAFRRHVLRDDEQFARALT